MCPKYPSETKHGWPTKENNLESGSCQDRNGNGLHVRSSVFKLRLQSILLSSLGRGRGCHRAGSTGLNVSEGQASSEELRLLLRPAPQRK